MNAMQHGHVSWSPDYKSTPPRTGEAPFAAARGCGAFHDAMLKVEAALKELEAVCEDEALKRETRSIREAYQQRRTALEQLKAKCHNAPHEPRGANDQIP